jgi:hypothetical protein
VRRLALLLGLSCGLATVLLACREVMPSNRYLRPRATGVTKSTADARGRFDHARHAAVLESAHVTCADCHRFDVQIETADETLAREVAGRALQPGSAACHFCHTDDTKMAAAPGACTTCHQNLAALRPENHDLTWSTAHAAMARANPEDCANCHKQAECINCHERRDTIQTVVHDRNFRFIHGIQARATPMQCGNCHREDYCIRCHQQGKVVIEP